jgi:hypothetical protein
MTTLERPDDATIYALATEHIDAVHHSLRDMIEDRQISDPERYAVPIMIDQTEKEQSFHFRVGFTTLAARLALKKTSVVIPLVVSSFEITPNGRIVPFNNISMQIGGESLRSASLLTGREVTDMVWSYVKVAPKDSAKKASLLDACTLIDQALLEAEQQQLIPIL